MKCGCTDCRFYSEGNDGDYGGGPFWFECGHPIMADVNRRIEPHEMETFPFYPAPGCFGPNPFSPPDYFFPTPFHSIDGEGFYEWISSAKKWSGDAIELIEHCTTSARPESVHKNEKAMKNRAKMEAASGFEPENAS